MLLFKQCKAVSTVWTLNSVNSVNSVSSVGRVNRLHLLLIFPRITVSVLRPQILQQNMILMLLFSRQIKMSSPNLNNVIIIGCILCYSRWSKNCAIYTSKINSQTQNIRNNNPPKYFQRNHSRSRLLYHINQRFSVHLHSQGEQVKRWEWCTKKLTNRK